MTWPGGGILSAETIFTNLFTIIEKTFCTVQLKPEPNFNVEQTYVRSRGLKNIEKPCTQVSKKVSTVNC